MYRSFANVNNIYQFPLDRGGSEMPWNSPIIISLFSVGGVLGLAFIFVEGKIAKFPVIPGHVFKIRTVVSVYISIFFTGFLYFGEIYYLPIYLQVRDAKLDRHVSMNKKNLICL
jgi:hypothetical protein